MQLLLEHQQLISKVYRAEQHWMNNISRKVKKTGWYLIGPNDLFPFYVAYHPQSEGAVVRENSSKKQTEQMQC